MSSMELIAIAAGTLVLVVALVLWAFMAIAKRMPDNRPRRATKWERARNQAEVDAWFGRTKGEDHVKRMRGEV
ncbi:hypothetical protein [Microbacterium sp. A94]|uniref:hypothetical protein n=1 Tax=Microbacterium sp. A94 TaxID=3450717 RepID=UPI003F41D070